LFFWFLFVILPENREKLIIYVRFRAIYGENFVVDTRSAMTTYEMDGQGKFFTTHSGVDHQFFFLLWPQFLYFPGKFIPASQRPDGSWRKPRRVRDGYVPQEEVPLYESKGKAFAQRLTANNTGLPVGMCPQVAQQERAKREKAKQQATVAAAKQQQKAGTVPGLLVLNDKKVTAKSKASLEAVVSKTAATKPTTHAPTMAELTNGVADMQVDAEKKLKKLKKKLREIETIEEKIRTGELKNPEKDQLDKVSRKAQIIDEISQLEVKQN
jgi:partner of Y14 and mago